jgi:hypothetical protein
MMTFGTIRECMEFITGTVIPRLVVNFQKEIAVSALENAIILSPVGTPPDDIHPGKFRGSHRVSVDGPDYAVLPDVSTGYSIPTESDARAAMAGLHAIGQEVWLVDDAATGATGDSYAPLLEEGFSPQAPDGIYEPTIGILEEQVDGIATLAVANTISELGL